MKRKIPASRATGAPPAKSRGSAPAKSAGAPARDPQERWLERHATAVLWVLIGGYVAAYGVACWIKYAYYLYTDFDLAIFTQAVSGVRHGSLYSSIRGMHWLGDHSSLNLFLRVPIYALFPSAMTLLMAQTISLAVGALPLYRLGRLQLGSRTAALGIAAAYLLYPAIGYTNLFEFHPEVLSTSALIATFAFLIEGRLAATLCFATLALLGKEDVALVVLGLALYALLLRRRDGWRFAAGLAGLALVSLAVSFLWLKPAFALGEADYGDMYRDWGHSPAQLVLNVLRRPLDAVGTFFSTLGDIPDSRAKLLFHLHLLLPFAALPLLSPGALLICFPILAEHLLSWRGLQHSIAYQYTALLTPFYAVSTVLAVRRLQSWLPRARAHGAGVALAAVVVLCAVASYVLFGPLSPVASPLRPITTERVSPDAEDRMMKPSRDRMVAKIRGPGAVIASFEFLARLANRDSVHSYHHIQKGVYTFSNKPYPLPKNVTAMLTTLGDQAQPDAVDRIEHVLRDNGLAPVDAAGELLLFRRGDRNAAPLAEMGTFNPTRPSHVVLDGQIAFLGSDLDTTWVRPGGLLSFHTYWGRIAPIDRMFMTEFWLFDATRQPAARRVRYLGYILSVTQRWPMQYMLREQYRYPVPLEVPPGTYHLVLRTVARLDEAHDYRQVVCAPSDTTVARYGGFLDLGEFEVRR